MSSPYPNGITLPASKEDGRFYFCEYMGYELIKEVDGTFYYHIPPGHACRFLINKDRWEKGIFDKNKFLDSLRN
jgi:hypothetical protein